MRSTQTSTSIRLMPMMLSSHRAWLIHIVLMAGASSPYPSKLSLVFIAAIPQHQHRPLTLPLTLSRQLWHVSFPPTLNVPAITKHNIHSLATHTCLQQCWIQSCQRMNCKRTGLRAPSRLILRLQTLRPSLTLAQQQQLSARFGALGDAYKFHWCGSGLVTPTHDTDSLQKSIRWSIASACQVYPTLNVLIAPTHADMHAIHRLLRPPQVHSLIRLPAAACKPSQVSTWWGRALPHSTPLQSDAPIYVTANPAGLHAYAPADVHCRLHQTLQILRIPGYQLGHHPAQYVGPLPRFRAPPGFQAAHIPTFPEPLHGPHP